MPTTIEERIAKRDLRRAKRAQQRDARRAHAELNKIRAMKQYQREYRQARARERAVLKAAGNPGPMFPLDFQLALVEFDSLPPGIAATWILTMPALWRRRFRKILDARQKGDPVLAQATSIQAAFMREKRREIYSNMDLTPAEKRLAWRQLKLSWRAEDTLTTVVEE